MDLNKLIPRARSLLVTPRTEWPVIAAEPATVGGLYREYILPLAAIPPVCGFVKQSLIGFAWHGFRVYRLGIGAGLSAAIVEYLVTLVAVYVLAVILDSIAPQFGGEPGRIQALKLTAYAYTAIWITGFGRLLPSLGVLIALAGAVYGVYLLYLGATPVMKVPPERAGGYTAITVIVAIVLIWLTALVTGGIAGATVLGFQ